MASRIRGAVLAILMALGLTIGVQATPASAAVQVDISVFHDRLAPYGHWVRHPRYGWVWYPTGVEVGWRPYTHGHWVWTDAYGWYWESDYPWGWAPFHYGRWAFDDEYGWIWVPATVWGPAWVVWRSGNGYAGWAPLPPAAVWQDGIGFGGFDIDVHYGPAWTFCEERYLAARHPVLLPPAQNVTIIKRTTNVTNYVAVDNRIVNKSIDVHHIEAAAHTRITPVHVRDVDHPEPNAKRHDGNGEVHAFRPAMERPGAAQSARNIEQPMLHPEIEERGSLQNLHEPKQQRETERHEQRPRWLYDRQLRCRENPIACYRYP